MCTNCGKSWHHRPEDDMLAAMEGLEGPVSAYTLSEILGRNQGAVTHWLESLMREKKVICSGPYRGRMFTIAG